ncbi:AbiH family protein [Lacrimispora xylanisolvens]|uniref:AbiH family protein n=1 Tax=Lacrimispora xylanisolvens TaxID=384636 RepID=UPI00240283AC
MGFTNYDRYLVFNYTHMLQNIYGIEPKNICYVHGECTGNEEDELIFGHGNKKRIMEIKNIIDGYDRRSLFQSERTNQLEYECLLRFMQNLEKDVNRCKWVTEMFYNRFLEEPEIINVYGMSLGDVDFPYFKQIRDRWPETKWRFGYHSKQDEDKIKILVKRLAIPDFQYKTFKFDNPIFREIMDIIVAKTGIIAYEEVKSN